VVFRQHRAWGRADRHATAPPCIEQRDHRPWPSVRACGLGVSLRSQRQSSRRVSPVVSASNLSRWSRCARAENCPCPNARAGEKFRAVSGWPSVSPHRETRWRLEVADRDFVRAASFPRRSPLAVSLCFLSFSFCRSRKRPARSSFFQTRQDAGRQAARPGRSGSAKPRAGPGFPRAALAGEVLRLLQDEVAVHQHQALAALRLAEERLSQFKLPPARGRRMPFRKAGSLVRRDLEINTAARLCHPRHAHPGRRHPRQTGTGGRNRGPGPAGHSVARIRFAQALPPPDRPHGIVAVQRVCWNRWFFRGRIAARRTADRPWNS